MIGPFKTQYFSHSYDPSRFVSSFGYLGNFCYTGYWHDGRTDKDSYPHDGRADKDSYPHDSRADKNSYPHNRHNQNIMVSL